MKKLLNQILKFGVVGGISFVIDFVITLAVAAALRKVSVGSSEAAAIGAFFGFTISVIVNYILSMRFVFERRDDMNKKKEFAIFVTLSLIGLGINEAIIYGCMKMIENIGWCQAFTSWSADVANVIFGFLRKEDISFDGMATAGSKIIATAVVMVYNFVSRKKTLEKKDDK